MWLTFSDDLLVHGRNVEEHDKILIKVLERLEEKNLTLNADKCTFEITKIVFMGLLLTKYGNGPTEEKVKSIIEGSQP